MKGRLHPGRLDHSDNYIVLFWAWKSTLPHRFDPLDLWRLQINRLLPFFRLTWDLTIHPPWRVPCPTIHIEKLDSTLTLLNCWDFDSFKLFGSGPRLLHQVLFSGLILRSPCKLTFFGCTSLQIRPASLGGVGFYRKIRQKPYLRFTHMQGDMWC